MDQSARLRFAARYASRHLIISIAVALLAALLVFQLWYPAPTAKLLNVGPIYLLMLAVDGVCGPILTLVLASPAKLKRELIQDICIVAVVRLVALGLGLTTLEKGRPIAYVFEQDRLVLVTKNELYTGDCVEKCMPALPLWGIGWRSVGSDKSTATLESLELSLQGVSPAMRPTRWKDWNWNDPKIQSSLHSLSALSKEKFDELSKITGGKYAANADTLFLPLVSSKTLDWIALFNRDGNWLGALPIDGFSER